MRIAILGLILALLTACSAGPAYQAHTLPNGKEVKIIGITKMFSTNRKNKWLILNYQTDLPISDASALGKEADEIWVYFKNDAEQAGMTEALIKAHSPPTGTFIKKTNSYGFAYKKLPDGTWSRVGG